MPQLGAGMLCLADRSFFGFEVTAILDYEQAPAAELAALYPERWEIEMALDELKTHLRGGAHVVLRSKTPDLVRQDFWGMVPAHFAVRGLMHEAVLAANEDPDRLSFTHAVRVIRRQLPQLAASPLGGGELIMTRCRGRYWRNEWCRAAGGESRAELSAS